MQEPLDCGDDFRDGFDRADVVVGRQDVQGFHVCPEEFNLAGGQLAPVDAGGRCAFEQGVIHVGDVLDIGDLLVAVPPRAVQEVKSDIAGGMAHVGGVVRGDSADVH